MLKRSHRFLARLLSAGLLAGALAAGTAPFALAAGESAAFRASGNIDYIEQKNNTVVINDSQYNLAGNVQIHSTSGHTDKYGLRKGMDIGFNFIEVGRDRTISEVWVLPGK